MERNQIKLLLSVCLTLKQFLEEKVRPMWPKGWMQKRFASFIHDWLVCCHMIISVSHLIIDVGSCDVGQLMLSCNVIL